jgi:hypothetical protein
MKRNKFFILLFSFIISFLVSYEYKKYKLESYFGNNIYNYFQIENIHKFKKDNMIFDYAGVENFKVIIYTNELDKAKIDTEEFIDQLNDKMNKECYELKNIGLLDEFMAMCKSNRVLITKQKINKTKKFDYLKFILVFFNLFLILNLLNTILSNIKLNKPN